jgi:dTDP-4-dehydrorhamnose 3,5-epimerase
MIFTSTNVDGAWLIEPERHEDERGFFARTFCLRELSAHGLDTPIVQRSISYNRRCGTLRGMHFQAGTHEEIKLVSCSRGAIYDVVLDLRPESPTYRRWWAATLTADNGHINYVPKGCAHGFITLTDHTAVDYQISEFYEPGSARGVRYDDPAFRIDWPMAPVLVNERDLAFPPYKGR